MPLSASSDMAVKASATATFSSLDVLWVLICAALVFLMQGGFLCLESGLTRTKNAINVAMKNAFDFMVGAILFWLYGFGVMFGKDWMGWLGISHFAMPLASDKLSLEAAFFIFEFMFCATATTIVSGAVAERMRFVGYAFYCVVISGIIYPIFGHWAWGGAFFPENAGFLMKSGFVDFAGSTVVHSVGGWASLAGVLVLGPRLGRFRSDGSAVPIPGSNIPLAMVGMILLFFGWLGFNGGSTLHLDGRVPGIIANSILAGAAGGITASCFGFLRHRLVSPDVLLNGALAGLVSITASCHVVSAWDALVIGAMGGMLMLGASFLLLRLRIDDAVGAIPAHLAPGIWGTLAVAVFGNPALLGTGLGHLDQFLAQLMGVAVCGLWSFGVAYLAFWLFDRLHGLRVTAKEEIEGLNVSEHGASSELLNLLTMMEKQQKTANLSLRVPVEPFTEVGQIASLYNKVMESLEKAVGKMDSVFRGMRDAVLTFTPSGVVNMANPSAERLFGLPASKIVGKPLKALFLQANGVPLSGAVFLRQVRRQGIVECLINTPRQTPVEIGITENLGKEGLLSAVVRDISARQEAVDKLHAEKELAQVTLSAIGDAVIRADALGQVTYLNPVAAKMTGWSLEDAMGKPVDEIAQLRCEANDTPLDLLEALKQAPVLNLKGFHRLFSREEKIIPVSFTGAQIHDAHAQVVGYVLVIRDMSEEHKLALALSHQATHDPLTGLRNREAFERELANTLAMAKSGENEVASVAAFIDLDRFKIVNDTCGHLAGDQLLRKVASLLEQEVRDSDVVARLGGDEFAAILRGCPLSKAEEIANHWLQELRNFVFHWEGKSFTIGASVGLVRVDAQAQNIAEVLAQADAACYAAKSAGRGQVHVYLPDDYKLATKERERGWAARITQALEENHFRLYVQKVVPTGATPGREPFFEVMVRLVLDGEEIVSPEAFLPAAERFNLASAIDKHVVREFFRHWPTLGMRGPYSINLSGASLADPEVLELLQELFSEHWQAKGQVWFEMDEAQVLSRFAEAKAFMEALGIYGCRFSLDRFGTSSAAITQLAMLPVHVLKFDPHLIVHAIAEPERFRLVLALNQLGHALDLSTVVKFIEDEATLKMVKRLGVDYAQGQAVSPIEPLAFFDFSDSWSAQPQAMRH